MLNVAPGLCVAFVLFPVCIVELVKPGQSRREPMMSGERQIYVCVCVCVCVCVYVCVCVCVSHSVMSESLQPHRL